MKSSGRPCQGSMIFEFVHGRKQTKTVYTDLYTKTWDSMAFGDIVHKCAILPDARFTADWCFMILHGIMGLSSSLSAILLDLQALTSIVHEFVHEKARF